MKQYLALLQAILDNGVVTSDRTGTGTMTLSGYQYQIKLEQDENGIIHNFLLFTTKTMSLKSVCEELIWKLRGDTNIKFLVEQNNHIWTDVSGVWIEGINQLMNAIDLININLENSCIIISLWNLQDLEKTFLPPCPYFYQFFANEQGHLHFNVYKRSCDSFLGIPYNTAQDALFLCMMAHVTGRKPGIFTHMFGDAHIYLNHVDQVKEQLTREPREAPSIHLNTEVKDILDFTVRTAA